MAAPLEQAVVLAGGQGTRLGALTSDTPKPLLDVGGRPFIEWVIANLERQGVTEVILTVGYRAQAFEEWLRSREASDASVALFVEEAPLGTGGALPLLADRLDEHFCVVNGDTLFDVDLRALSDLRARQASEGAVGLRAVRDVSRYGGVALEGDHVREFTEKGGRGPGLINGGVYVLTSEALDGLESPASIELDLLPALADRGTLVGLPSDGFFIDIGIPEAYVEAQEAVPQWWRTRRSLDE